MSRFVLYGGAKKGTHFGPTCRRMPALCPQNMLRSSVMRAARPEVAPLGRRVGELIIPRGGGARATQFSAGRAGGEENAEARAIQQLLCCATRRHAFIVRARGVTAAKGRGT